MAGARLVTALQRLAADEPLGDLLRGSRAGPAAGRALADGLRGCSRAHRALDLYGLSLLDAGALALLHALAEWPGCTSLDVGANGLGVAAACALAPLLLLDPPPSCDDLFFLPDEDRDVVMPSLRSGSVVPIRELRASRNAPTFDGAACAALLAPSVLPEGVLALSALALAFNPIGADGAAAIGAALRAGRLPHLETLQMHACTLGAEGARSLAAGLPAAKRLHHLDLSDNAMGDAGACALAAELPAAPALRELLLGRNSLGETAAHALATALLKQRGHGGCQLSTLSLAHNHLRDTAARALADALAGTVAHANRTLTCLDLRANKLSDAAVLALGDALVANARLTSLDLSANRRIGAEGLAAVEQLLTHNRLAAKRQPAPECVAPNKNATALADPRVQRLFSQNLADSAPARTAAAADDATEASMRLSALGSVGGTRAAPARRRPTAGGARQSVDDAASREGRLCAEVRTELGNVHTELDAAGREVARLRQREATLEAALRREGLMRAPVGGASWECVTLS